jgi:GGDEF domain-containing protein
VTPGSRRKPVAAAAWRTQLRPEDLLARYGGEEFGAVAGRNRVYVSRTPSSL